MIPDSTLPAFPRTLCGVYCLAKVRTSAHPSLLPGSVMWSKSLCYKNYFTMVWADAQYPEAVQRFRPGSDWFLFWRISSLFSDISLSDQVQLETPNDLFIISVIKHWWDDDEMSNCFLILMTFYMILFFQILIKWAQEASILRCMHIMIQMKTSQSRVSHYLVSDSTCSDEWEVLIKVCKLTVGGTFRFLLLGSDLVQINGIIYIIFETKF